MLSEDLVGGNNARLIAKLSANTTLPAGQALSLEDLLGGNWNPAFQAAVVSPMFEEIPSARISRLGERAIDRDCQYGHLRECCSGIERYIAIDCAPEVVISLLRALRESCRIELAYQELGSSVASVVSTGCQFARQGYLMKAPTGIDAVYSWQFSGGTGSSVRFIDLEQGWNLDHRDLIDGGFTIISGQVSGAPQDLDHGTAVLGIIAAQDNGKDLLGVAHGLASARVVSPCRGDGGKKNVALALLEAIYELRYGDILLVEIEAGRATGKQPLEIERVVFDLLRLATALGIVVIEPAGNGGRNVAEFEDDSGGAAVRPLDTHGMHFRDSGAILVGSSRPDFSNPGLTLHPKRSDSNSGDRVDCFSWGAGIMTTWNSSVSPPPLLRLMLWGEVLAAQKLCAICSDAGILLASVCRDFQGTSGASAIVAGVAILVQSLAQSNLGFRFSPWQLRLLLSDPENGTPSLIPATDGIGTMPDLKKIIDKVLRISATAEGLFEPLSTFSRIVDTPECLQAGLIEELSPDYLLIPFRVLAQDGRRRVEVLSRLPRLATLWLEMPGEVADLRGIWREPDVRPTAKGNIYMLANPNGQSYFREASFLDDCECRLVIKIPPELRGRPFEIGIRLLDGWRELARISWVLPSLLVSPEKVPGKGA